MEIIKL